MHTAIVEAVIPNPEHTLLPGGFATMKIECATHTDKLLVPAGSVISQSGQDYLWIAQGAGQMYEAVICHAKYTAAQAKKYHYICPMDHGKMVPISTPLNQAITAHEIVVETGASDGDWTEIEPGAVSEGDRVIDKGQAGLTEGATVVSVAWGPNGPVALPRAAQADSGRIVYRCDKCGMTFSAADAKKDNYIDPMDGGHLIPVKPNNAMPGMKM
jgi:multidrug efflux pump subunit AcrA (membrane-fusion protein)/DNA-directed RNA polymerase subunit RPC12/RpoP